MNNLGSNETDKEIIITKVCDFLKQEKPNTVNMSIEEAIRVVCVARLCKAVGITGKYNYKSDYFTFFSSVMGEAVCEKLKINMHLAGDELRLIRYDRVNLVSELKYYLDNETVEEAFLDAFHFIENFKYLIPKLKKV